MANNIENEKVIDMQKERETRKIFRRIRKSLENEKMLDDKKLRKAIEEDDPNYLKRVK